jgi:hypothetical protein
VRKDAGSEIDSDDRETFDFFLIYAQYSRLCGKIAKQLYSASALSRPFSDMLSIATELDDEILRWRECIPLAFRPGTSFRPSNVPNNVPFIHALVLNFGYSYAICAIYRRFNAMFLPHDSQPRPRDLRAMKSVTATKCLEAAKSMILLTKHLDIESHSPGWYVHHLKHLPRASHCKRITRKSKLTKLQDSLLLSDDCAYCCF